MGWRMYIQEKLWPLAPEQSKALGQVILSLGVAAMLAAASLVFMPTPGLSCYGLAVRVGVLCALIAVAIPVGLILHRRKEVSDESIR